MWARTEVSPCFAPQRALPFAGAEHWQWPGVRLLQCPDDSGGLPQQRGRDGHRWVQSLQVLAVCLPFCIVPSVVVIVIGHLPSKSNQKHLISTITERTAEKPPKPQALLLNSSPFSFVYTKYGLTYRHRILKSSPALPSFSLSLFPLPCFLQPLLTVGLMPLSALPFFHSGIFLLFSLQL